MIMITFELLLLVGQHIWLRVERAALQLQRMWYDSEIKYLDQHIAELERDLREPQE